jgi:hypothetical protein
LGNISPNRREVPMPILMPRFAAFRAMACGLTTAAILATGAGPALADAIDGSWCSEDGRRIVIEGPSGTTPAGVQIRGDYTRHSFAFTMPPPEGDAGAAVAMMLQGETRVQVTIGSTVPQVWRRCPPGIS